MPEVNKSGPKEDELVGKSRFYVDDCAQSAIDSSASRFYNKLGNSFMKFNKLRIRLKLGLSDKGVVCCSDFPIAKLLQKEINVNWDVFYKISKDCRDIGVSYTAGVKRPTTELIKKFDGAKARNNKILALSKISRNARKLFSGSGFPASVWGHPACGLSLSLLTQLARRAANSTGINQGTKKR